MTLVPKDKCSVPPPGWTCSRQSGHGGPCAATQATDLEPYIDAETDLCVNLLIARMKKLETYERGMVFYKLYDFFCGNCGKELKNNVMCHCENDE